MSGHDHDLEFYGDPGIASKNAPIPFWLLAIYFVLPFWGLACFYLYWNGAYGWLDRGYWKELEVAANTTFPFVNHSDPQLPETSQEFQRLQNYP